MSVVTVQIGSRQWKLAGQVESALDLDGIWLHGFRPEPMFIHSGQIVQVDVPVTLPWVNDG